MVKITKKTRVKQIKGLAFAVFFCLFALSSFSGELKFHHFSVNEGLPSNVVNTIFQDKAGFIWLGTKEGLVRFDGHRMVPVAMPEEKFDLLSKQKTTALCEDFEDNLWIGTSFGLLRYNQVTETFKHYLFDEGNRLDLSRFINSIALREDGTLWVGTRNGLFYLDKEKDQFVVYPYFAHHNEFQSMTKGERIIKKIYFDRLGYLWVGTEGNGVSRLDLNNHSKIVYLNDPLNPNTLCSNFIETIFEDSFGILWFGTTYGLARFDRENESFWHLSAENKATGLSDNIVTSLMEDGMGNLYIGTRNGLDLFNRRERRITHYLHHPDNPYSLCSNSINCCLRDRTGAYWVGTTQGLSSFSYHIHHFELYQSVPGNTNSLTNNTLRTIIPDHGNNIWIGTQNNGIDRFDRGSGKFHHYDLGGVEKNRINTAFLSHSGELFFGTGAGIVKYQPEADRFELFDFDGKIRYTNKGIYEIAQDKAGNIYFSELDRGLFCYNSRLKTLKEIDLGLTGVDPWKAKNIKVLHFDKNDELWLSLHMAGLARHNFQTGKTVQWQQGQKGLQSNQVWEIFENGQGIWLGTENGLYRYSPETDTFSSYNVQQGLPGSLVVSILEDNANRLWLGTNKGLSCFSPQEGTFVNYSTADGLQGEVFEYKVRCKTGKYLFFGGNNGLNVFNPLEFTANSYVPVPRFTNLNISKHAVKTNERAGSNIPLKRSIIFSNQIRLKESHRDIEIEFSAFSYINSRKNSYAYQFSGDQDTSWHYTPDNRNSVYFPRLKPGNYLLKVKAANCDGIWSKEPAVLEIRVTRDFKKAVGYVSNSLLALLLLGLLISFRKTLAKLFTGFRPQEEVSGKEEEISPKFKLNPNLDPLVKKDLQALIDSMEKEKMYLDKRLTKIQLATHLKISLAHLSNLLKNHLDVGFNDFVNYYRVEAVKRMMTDPKNRNFTLLSISEDCGFNSKTSFYRIFKHFTGWTPAEYLERYVNVKK